MNNLKQTDDFFDKAIVNFLQSLDKKNFSEKDKIILFKEIAYLIKWGISLNEATNILQESTDNFALKDMASTIQIYLKRGMSLSYSLSRLPDYFNEWDIAVIKTGEASGKLAIVLESLAKEYEYTKEIKNKYIWAMIYPIMLLIISIIAVISLFTLVLPSIFSIADSFQNLELPRATRILRDLSEFLKIHWKSIAGSITAIWIIIWLFSTTEKWKKIWFSTLMQIPLIGKMTQYYYIVKFCRYMKLMNSSWMNYIQTFLLLKEILGISAYQDMLEEIINWLKEGKDIYTSIKNHRELIPADIAIMIKVGEQTANLDESLNNVLQMYESELDIKINRLSKVIEPIMLIGMWGIVVIIAYAVFWLILHIMEWVWL